MVHSRRSLSEGYLLIILRSSSVIEGGFWKFEAITKNQEVKVLVPLGPRVQAAQRPLPAKVAAVGTLLLEQRRGERWGRPYSAPPPLLPAPCPRAVLASLRLFSMKEAETLCFDPIWVEPPDPSQEPVICPRGGRGFGGEETRRKTLWARSLGAQGQHHRGFIRAAVRRSVSEPGEHHPTVGAWLSE